MLNNSSSRPMHINRRSPQCLLIPRLLRNPTPSNMLQINTVLEVVVVVVESPRLLKCKLRILVAL
jgi:hypothetical protein